MDAERKRLLEELGTARNSKVLLFVTGDRPNWETAISPDVFDHFVHHLDEIGVTEKITLVLYTNGGDTLTAWSLINLIQQFCDELEVLVPSRCRSSGTLMSLGASRIIMTKQATLGPIDPSINTPLNPMIDGNPQAKFSVSVEAVKGFFELAREEVGSDSADLNQALSKLTDSVHPLVLGLVQRTKAQIQMLAQRLLAGNIKDEKNIEKIVSFLCSDSGSHDYTINRREAKALGLNIEIPDDELYDLIRRCYRNFADELKLNNAFDFNAYLGADVQKPYTIRRALVESTVGGSFSFVSEGILSRVPLPGSPPGAAPNGVNDTRQFEGWRHTS